MISDPRTMTWIYAILDHKRIGMEWEPRLLVEFNRWRAARHVFGRMDAIRMTVRWAAAHDTTGRQRPVRPTDPLLTQLDAFRDAHVLLARSEALKLAILTVLRQPWPIGNARPPKKGRRPVPKPQVVRVPLRLVAGSDVTG